MGERQLRRLIAKVKAGRMSRRAFVRRMIALGLTAPLASQMLAYNGVAAAPAGPDGRPVGRGGGGTLKLLWWESPTLLNPHFAVGIKDQEASRIFYEPLAGWDSDGNLIPFLAAEIPDVENGGVARDGRSVTWKLKPGVQWHDGRPLTADDVVFTREYAADPATAAVTIGNYRDLTVEKIDPLTVRIRFNKPTPFWADAFVGSVGMILPRHMFEPFRGAKSREAPANLAPVGTGPYRFVAFNPGDVLKGELNPTYHVPDRPHFDAVEMKGGGDAVAAARAVIQTGDYDFAWNMQVEDDILQRLEKDGRGRAQIIPSGNIEHIQLNSTDPWTEVDGERSSVKTQHPFFSNPAVRQAIGLLVDRTLVQDNIYGRTGVATANYLNNPERFRSKSRTYEFNVDKASELLELAGWKRGPDGIRMKDGTRLKLVFQTSINSPRQKTQAIIKRACEKAGIEMELKALTASVFFSADVANPDIYTKFHSDMQMFTSFMGQPDPQNFMGQFTSWEVASMQNKWQGRNIPRWRNEEYDKAFLAAEGELDPVKRAALFIRMNDLICGDNAVVPVVCRPRVQAVSKGLHVDVSGWDNDLWNPRDWYRDS